MGLLNEYKLPVWVMEPLRGGKLAALADEYTTKLRSLRPDESTPAWAFRFLQSIGNVTMILSGMSNEEQLRENIRTFETEAPLNQEETGVLLSVADTILGEKTLACTACRYCTSHCPKELDIPMLLELYNEHSFTEGGFLAPMALMALPKEKHPTSCIGCKSCEAVCPQQLKISQAMADFAGRLE